MLTKSESVPAMLKTLQKPKKIIISKLGPVECYHFDRRISQILAIPQSEAVLYTPDLAAWFGVSEICVKFWRLRKCGPPFKASSHVVRYSREAVEQWLRDRQATLANEVAK